MNINEPTSYPFFKWVAKLVPRGLSANYRRDGKFRISGSAHFSRDLEEWYGSSGTLEGLIIVTKCGIRIGPLFVAWNDTANVTRICSRCVRANA